jgi:hypothetical protein
MRNCNARRVLINIAPIQAAAIAGRFVSLLFKHRIDAEVLQAEHVSQEGIDIVFGILRAAGFKARGLAPRHSGDTSPFIVIDETGGENSLATGWLECATKCVRDCGLLRRENRHDVATVLVAEIKRSAPLLPIQLSAVDVLVENPPSLAIGEYPYFVRHAHDDDALSTDVGVHQDCGGDYKWYRLSAPFYCIACLKCHRSFRIPLNTACATYRALRAYAMEHPGGV